MAGDNANDLLSGGTGDDELDGGNGFDRCWPELVVLSDGSVAPNNSRDSAAGCEQINQVLN